MKKTINIAYTDTDEPFPVPKIPENRMPTPFKNDKKHEFFICVLIKWALLSMELVC